MGRRTQQPLYSSYIDEFDIGPTNSGPQRIVGAQSTWDAYASYMPVPGLTVLFGVQNLFNTIPPFTNASSNNFAAGYSALFSNPIMRDFISTCRTSSSEPGSPAAACRRRQ